MCGRLKKKQKKRFIIMTYEQHNDNFTCSSPNGNNITDSQSSLFLSPGHLFMPIQQHSLKLLERPSMAQIKQCFHVLKWSKIIIIINNIMRVCERGPL